jgi:diadenosine tetraphosphate (Ap4A) HIT family hydrolase
MVEIIAKAKDKSRAQLKREDVDELYQYKLGDLMQLKARSGAEFWYGEIWKTVGKCVFCDLRKRYIIKELDGMVLTVNIFPYVDGSLMIVPKEHITHIKDLTSAQWEAVRVLEYVAGKMIKAIFKNENLWVLYREGGTGDKSQKTVEHMHIHLLPYQEGLVNWNYKQIKIPPFETAAIFRDNIKVIDSLIERFKNKSGGNGKSKSEKMPKLNMKSKTKTKVEIKIQKKEKTNVKTRLEQTKSKAKSTDK